MTMRRYELNWRMVTSAMVVLCGWCSVVGAAEQDELIAVLKSDAPLFEKARACQQLSIMGGDDAVPVLAALLGDEQLGEYARFALEPMTGPKVDAAFRAALSRLDGRLLAGVINSIAVRGDAEAVPALTKIARDAGSDARAAAIAALGRIATDDAVRTIRGMLKDRSAKVRVTAADACLVAAERRQARDAAKVYDAVGRADVPAHVQAAGVYGAIMAAGDEGASLLIEQLDSGDPVRVDVALRAARELEGDGVTEELVKYLGRAEPGLQALMIGALADRGDVGAYASIKALAASANAAVRLEAISVLGRIGDASAVPVLVPRIGGGGPEAKAAAAALRRLEAEGVDGAIVEMLEAAQAAVAALLCLRGTEGVDDALVEKLATQGDELVVLIEILTSRAAKGAVPALLDAASGEDANVAVAAFKGLTLLADGADTPALVELLAGLKSEAARGYAENAVVAAAGRIADETVRADAVLEELNSEQPVTVSGSLLRVAGRIANAKAFEAVDSAATSEDPEIRDIAIRALAAWPDGRALERLAAIAQDGSNTTHRVLALRGYVRLLASDMALSDAEKVAKYEHAMGLARGDADRKLVLAGLANVRHPDALPIAMALVEDAAVKDEAMLAALKIAQATAGARPAAARDAALKIADRASSPQMRDQAKALAEEIGPAVSIFDGRTFDGWEGNMELFRIEDGAIVGGMLDERIVRNEFMCTKLEYGDFELRLKVRLLGDAASANAGIQIRSRRIPDHHEMRGYQADMGQHYWGALYDESRRRKVLAGPSKELVARAVKLGQWNDYVIRCEGKRIRLWINGHNTVDYTEPDDAIEQVGLIGLQIHSGAPSEAWYRDITIEEL